jgi:rhodanese-related sulfurtransferase
MSKTLKRTLPWLTAALLLAGSPAIAQTALVTPTPITAEQAFDAVATQTDPVSGMPKTVLLVDVRTPSEYFWVGAAARVTAITLATGDVVIPDLGKVLLRHNGKFLGYTVKGEAKLTQVSMVKSMAMLPLAYNVPYQTWNETAWKSVVNESFGAQMAALAGMAHPVVIFYCRSGGRTDAANCVSKVDPALFDAIYEIDQPDGATNHGGLEGSDYGKAYNGYRGFPDRETWFQGHPAASWKDAGLPIVIGILPPAIPQ